MDTKFRKLISRLSIKEKKLEKIPFPKMISISPLPAADDPSTASGKRCPSPDLSRHSNAFYQLPNQNILTNVKFPCPTLLRKTRSMSIMRDGFYEEVKPKSPKVSGGSGNGWVESNGGVPVSHSDENNNLIGGGDDSGKLSLGSSSDEGCGPDYMNLLELEQERRRLMAAQRVRAKYAESWIDGQVEDDSIVGNNKEKTKLYWESRMRNESFEKMEAENQQKLNGLNKLRTRSSTNTSPIIQKINAEIEELHRREKELMNRSKPPGGSSGSQHEDEDDVFSSNGSSVDEFEPSESPRLESGFYSNLGEDETHILGSPELVKPEVIIETVGHGNKTPPPGSKDDKLLPLSVDVNLSFSVGNQQGSDGIQNYSPAVSESDDSKIFKFQKETPIEKEIRLASERDEEYRQRRLSSMAEGPFSPTPATPKLPAVSEKQKSPEPVVEVKAKTPDTEDKRFGGPAKLRNVQYHMATERLRKEILEAKQREAEVQTLHRTVSMSTVVFKDDGIDTAAWPKVPVTPDDPEVKTSPVPEFQAKNEVQHASTLEIESVKAPSQEAERKVKVELHRTTSSIQPITTSAQLRSPTFGVVGGFNSFNSIQRYLLKSSVQLRIAKNFQLPPPPVEKPDEIVPEVKMEVEEVKVEAPRRKLVPATHKIQNELREMKEREKELALIRTRSFKSTPNLLEALKDDDVQVSSGDVEDDKVSVGPPPFAPKERKRSTLINQWELLIQSGN